MVKLYSPDQLVQDRPRRVDKNQTSSWPTG